jgi:hypothetical protein
LQGADLSKAAPAQKRSTHLENENGREIPGHRDLDGVRLYRFGINSGS